MNTLFETQITHLTWPELEAGLDHIRQSPKDNGLLELIVCRPSVEERKVLEFGELDVQRGLIGDNWSTRGSSSTVDGGPNPEMQINIMNARAVALVAQQRERWHLAGDQLFLDMDLSKDNLPVGSRFSLGSAILEVTPPPHTGCSKFVARFGLEAMKFVNSEIGRSLCLRGINAKIVQSGSVEVGQLAKKI
ncbi:MAG: MOSC domain-containing protein [Blastocatellia bacterium]|nr:MAG: MOSC domain-containing protein [Blastocatellia bacterium]